MFRRGARTAVAAILLVGIVAVPATSALGDEIEPVRGRDALFITFAARVCGEYTDIMANKARNNLMESLRDLGPDTSYPPTGIVTPTDEQSGSPACAPLTGWRLTMGTGNAAKSPSTLDLSTVTNPYSTDIVTQASTPLLDTEGAPTGSDIEGAVTIQLSDEQASYARRGGKLWVQGGTPTAPLNGQQTTYGFAALRCAEDAVNGDNVEYVTFPQEQTHVFCYYYAVQPPPDPGTITIRKELASGTAGPASFTFVGNLSYADEDGDGVNDFTLVANVGSPGSETFVRGAVGPNDPPWTLSERVPSGWSDPGPPVCDADGSTITTTDGVTSIRLASGSDVVCTYTNQRVPLGNGILYKETFGGVGEFPVTVVGPDGFFDDPTAVTTEEGVPTLVAADETLVAGTYTISEQLPAPTAAGTWELVSAQCGDTELIGTVVVDGQWRRIDVELPEGGAAECLWINEFTPAGSITISKTTVGDVGTFPYAISELDESGNVVTEQAYNATATTTAEGVPVTATPVGDPATGIVVDPPSRFLVQELLPPWSAAGHWHVLDVDCGGNEVAVDRRGAAVEIELNTGDPEAVCAFTNEWVPGTILTLVKNTSSDGVLRPADAVLQITCVETEWPEEGDDYSFTVPPGSAQGASPELSIMHASRCNVDELVSGAADGIDVETTTTVTFEGAEPVTLESYDAPFDVPRGSNLEVVVDNTLTPPAPPPPDGPGEPGASGSLASSGAGRVELAALAGFAALALGLLAATASRMRQRRH